MRTILLTVSLLTFVASVAQAESVYFTGDGPDVAIKGYDPVAFHRQNAPVRGSAEHAHDWDGATWWFASAENRDLFAADSERYAPAYGGWCAWAVSRGYLQPSEPRAFAIVDGRLYLNWSAGVLHRWNVSRRANIASGDRRWPELRAGLLAESS